MSLTALRKLLESSKATVLVAVIIVLGALLYMGRIDAQQFLDTLIVLVPGWMLAHAGENGAKAIANGKKDAVAELVTNITTAPEPQPDRLLAALKRASGDPGKLVKLVAAITDGNEK